MGFFDSLFGGSDEPQVASTSSPAMMGFAKKSIKRDLLPEAQRVYQGLSSKDPRSFIAGFDPATLQAQDMIMQLAQGGSPMLSGMQDYMTSLLSGQFASPETNPWLAEAYNQAAGRMGEQFQNVTLPGMRSSAQGAGRSGSGVQALLEGQQMDALSQGLGSLANQMYGGAYQQNMQNMLTGAQMAPLLNQAMYQPAQMMDLVGQQRRGLEQQLLSADLQIPQELLAGYRSNIVGPWSGVGQQTTSYQPQQQSSGLLGQALGLGASLIPGLGLFSGGGSNIPIGATNYGGGSWGSSTPYIGGLYRR